MSPRVPLWARALFRLDHLTHAVANAERALLSELFFAALSAPEREAMTLWLYNRQPTYLPGGSLHDEGLFEWEVQALETAPFPRSGTVLLAAAGGGRELRALVSRGYRVVAFEPSTVLYTGLADVARAMAPSRVARGSYADLVAAVSDGAGPLVELLHGEHFDGVILGWTSLSHVLDARERAAIFHAVRALAPDAPVLASYLTVPPGSSPSGPIARARTALRRWFPRRGDASDDSIPSEIFMPWGGFFHLFTREQIEALARGAGYTVAHYDTSAYPWTLLVPRDPRD